MAQQSDLTSQTPPPRPSPSSHPTPTHTLIDLEADQPPPSEGKDATMHDFLSLCVSGSSSSTVTAHKTGIVGSVTTQDLLQPLRRNLNPVSSALNPLMNSNKHVKSSSGNNPSSGEPPSYSLLNGILEAPPISHSKYMISSISYPATAHISHNVDANPRQPRIPSEEDEEDDDESTDQGYSQKKDHRYQKCETPQQMEGRTVDNKGLTTRSKHSATEQRRRCKINDRFQMLRQLLPNSDQKRDKASFLLEVIEYIQMLHEKVTKYEAEFGGQQRPKSISWDNNFVHRDAVVSKPYPVLVSSLAYDTKEVSDSNGYSKSTSSPLRAACENGLSGPELMSNISHVSSLQTACENGLSGPELMSNISHVSSLQAMGCSFTSYDNKSLANKHALLSFEQPPSLAPPEPSLNTLYRAVPQTLPDGRVLFGHHIGHEEQTAAMKGKGSVHNKVDAIGNVPLFHHNSNTVMPRVSSNMLEKELGLSKIRNDNNSLRGDYEREEQKRSTQSIKLCPSEENGKTQSRLPCDNDEKDHPTLNVNRADDQHLAASLHGVINIRSAYSKGILDTLTQALQSAGVDLGQATMSVQIDLGKSRTTLDKSKTVSTTTGLPPQRKEVAESLQDLEKEHPKKRPKVEQDH